MSIGRLPLFRTDGRLKSDYVYLLICGEPGGPIYIKIGRTTNLAQRLSGLRSICPVPAEMFAFVELNATTAAQLLEKWLHRKFKARRITGEWFKFQAADKPEFNQGLRDAFSELHIRDAFWTKLPIKALDDYAKVGRAIALRRRRSFNYVSRRRA